MNPESSTSEPKGLALNTAVLSLFAALMITGVFSSQALADVSIATGPTPIPRGDAVGANDITVSNEWFAISIAVDTAPPWGVARGGILDIALIRDGKIGYDIASLVDFMPNQWSSWPTSYQRVSVEMPEPGHAVVRTERDWGEVELVTTLGIRDDDRQIHIVTNMTNRGESPLNDLISGYIVWPDGGSLFGVPGLAGEYAGYETAAMARWSAAYGKDWTLGLHAPFSQYVDYGGRDRYQSHTLQPGESRQFEAWLQIEHGGGLTPLVNAEIERGNAAAGNVSGFLRTIDGSETDNPAVVFLKNGKPYTWVMGRDGRFTCRLPVGEYEAYATAPGHAQGATRSLTVTNGGDVTLDFTDIRPPGQLQVTVSDARSGTPLDARISIREGYRQLISHFGRNTFFTDLDDVGRSVITIPPGDYTLDVSSGGGFTSRRQTHAVRVESGNTHELDVAIESIVHPGTRHWHSIDLHHHSDVLDGFTEASYVLRSQLAAGLDIGFLSDHDSVENNARMQALSEARAYPFIAGTELSPSWAHFNAFPIDDDKVVEIDTGQATVQEVFAEARRMGADLIEANHPYSRYGYFESLEQEVHRDGVLTSAVPGGLDLNFELAEIVPGDLEANTKTIERVWRFWNDGHRIYLAAGSDVHDVWLSESGSARTFVFAEDPSDTRAVVNSLKNGHAFATSGPMIYPDMVFGSKVRVAAGETLALRYTAQSVSGIQSIGLVERARHIDSRTYDSPRLEERAEFIVQPVADTWYSVIVTDAADKVAYSNPVWVTVKHPDTVNALQKKTWFTVGATLLSLIIIILAMRLRRPDTRP